METLHIYNQGIIKLLCDALDIQFEEGLVYRVYINPKSNNCRIYSGSHYFYNSYITPEIVKILNKVLNREV